MIAIDYFLPAAADHPDLSAWVPLLPSQYRVLRTNLFGDHFLVDGAGAVHMLDRGGCSVELIARSEEEFWREVQDDPEGWQLRSLADECRQAGKTLADGQCYAFTTPPILGGVYTVENVWMAPWREWFSFTSDLFKRVEGLPDGSTVSLKVVE
ncbi:T6SS immunity protein Tdi1 domain-containing protein [uncultured Sphingomonas sp.]|uniref:T6SS immunity protein Tdi1 domain-containing protein n=1 Tax=uncultured Sphingomonas sp. TaxID=158754 RepID=UPI0035CBA84B